MSIQSENDQQWLDLPDKPAGSKWTDEQWRAVVAKGKNLLVAAAAGSGKTAVLVERIIHLLCNSTATVQMEQLLVATFTKAAAAEMKVRIRLALEKKLATAVDTESIQRQMALMNQATITTLHSFCLEVIQRHFQSIALDPLFRIANKTEIELLRQEVLLQLFEECYVACTGEFKRMVDWFSGERYDDEAIYELVQQLYDFSRSHPWPADWLERMTMSFQVKTSAELYQSPWVHSIIKYIQLSLQGIVELLQQAYRLLDVPGGPEPYRQTLREDLAGVTALLPMTHAGQWEQLQHLFEKFSFGRLASCRGEQYEPSLQAQVKRLREQAKTQLHTLRQTFFQRTLEQFWHELNVVQPMIRTLIDIVQQFAQRYEAAKRSKRWLDFSDLEHYCLRILRHVDSTPDQTIPSEIAKQYQQQFVEILLDEYQDTNLVQEAIIDLLTHTDKGNRFMVGDVKQSIYRFRLAEPSLFLHKYQSYSTGEENGLRIDLARNFRSRSVVVHTVNMLFRQIMHENVVELTYDSAAELICGASYPATVAMTESAPSHHTEATEFIIIDKAKDTVRNDEQVADEQSRSEEEQGRAEGETAQLEARVIAAKIHHLFESKFQVFDKKLQQMRPLMYRDIVILLRSTQTWAPLMVEQLRLESIPAYAEFHTGYFQATEVEVIVALLQIIDNPQQDIPLAAVLRSPIVGLTTEQLAHIRLVDKNLSFYAAVCQSVQQLEDRAATTENQWRYKLQQFLQQLDHWRNMARRGNLSRLLWRLYSETGYYEWVGGLNGGLQRQANLQALYDRARQYEATSIRGLFRFLRFIERMRQLGGDFGIARTLGEQEDVVHVLTVHKSKGLEFPVVFIAGLAKKFNQRDLQAAFLLHRQLGFGPKYVDEQLRVTYPTLPYLALRTQMKFERLAEEMRVLYVALTRAQEKLILVGTVNNAEKSIQSWGDALQLDNLLLPDYIIAQADCYLDWIGAAVIRHRSATEWRQYADLPQHNGGCLVDDCSSWKLSLIPATEVSFCDNSSTEVDEQRVAWLQALTKLDIHANMPQTEWQQKLSACLSWRDPRRIVTLLPAKTSVTEMKQFLSIEPCSDSADERIHQPTEQHKPENGSLLLQRPKFMVTKQVTAAERGVAYHLFMQHVPLHLGKVSLESLQEVCAHLIKQKYITDIQAQAIDLQAIASFFNMEIGQQLLHANWVQRELPFSYGLTATEAYTVTTERALQNNDEQSIDNIQPIAERFIATSAFAACNVSELLDQETVLVQGVIDCLYEWNDQLVLLDYKTDHVLPERGGLQAYGEQYQLQLALYARAIEDIWKRPVQRKVLYFFHCQQIYET